MSSMSGSSAWPLSVSEYSTRGGTSGNVCRSMTPCSSSARRRSESVRGLIPASERSSSQKRVRPSARSRITRIVHLPEMISAVAVTGQLGSENCSDMRHSSIAIRTEVLGFAGALARKLPEQPAGSALAATRRGRRHAPLARLHQDPTRALERHLDRLAGAAPDEVLELHVGFDAG